MAGIDNQSPCIDDDIILNFCCSRWL